MVWDKYNRSNGGVTIDFYPNTLDNIFWSKEGIIAVGGSDHVSLFVSFITPFILIAINIPRYHVSKQLHRMREDGTRSTSRQISSPSMTFNSNFP